jgi:RNA polymerase sigma factor for flagellar operon FliA
MTTSQLDRHKLIEEGQPLVYSLATRIFRNIPVRVDFEDLVSYGELGLGEAARDFDSALGVKFTTFAWYRIQGPLRWCFQNEWTSRAAIAEPFHRMASEVLEEDSNSPNIVRTNLGVGCPMVSQPHRKARGRFFAVKSKALTKSSKTGPNRHLLLARREVTDRLVKLVDELPNQARILIRTIYFDGCTLHEAALRMGISKSWASRIHAKILEQLAKSLRSMGADP